jgi:hypothetical protein
MEYNIPAEDYDDDDDTRSTKRSRSSADSGHYIAFYANMSELEDYQRDDRSLSIPITGSSSGVPLPTRFEE